MAALIHLRVYQSKVLHTEQEIRAKRREWEDAIDPATRCAMERGISNLETLLVVFRKMVRFLAEIDRLETKCRPALEPMLVSD